MSLEFKARYLAALIARDKAMDAIYAAVAPRTDVVFSECRKLASRETNEAFAKADATLQDLDYTARQSGKAYQARQDALGEYGR